MRLHSTGGAIDRYIPLRSLGEHFTLQGEEKHLTARNDD